LPLFTPAPRKVGMRQNTIISRLCFTTGRMR